MKIHNGHYISSSGKHIPLGEMAFPHLQNAWNKAKRENDLETVAALEEEIQKRPKPEN